MREYQVLYSPYSRDAGRENVSEKGNLNYGVNDSKKPAMCISLQDAYAKYSFMENFLLPLRANPLLRHKSEKDRR